MMYPGLLVPTKLVGLDFVRSPRNGAAHDRSWRVPFNGGHEDRQIVRAFVDLWV
jgi:hypothetical protein